MNKKKSYTALRRKYSQIRKVEDCAIKDRYENQIITRDPLFHGKERLPNMQSITDFRVVNEVKPDEQTEFPPVPQDVYSSLHLMRYYPTAIPKSHKKEPRLSARGQNIENSDQKSSAKKGLQPVKAMTVEDVDMVQNSQQRMNTDDNEIFLEGTSQSEISHGDSMRKSHLTSSSKILNRKLLSEKKPTRTCKDQKHMKETEAFRRSTYKFQQSQMHEDSPPKRKISGARNVEDNQSPPVIISPAKRKTMEKNPYTLLRVQSQQMARKNTSQMKAQEDYLNHGRETENVIVTPVKTYGGKKESSKLLSSMNVGQDLLKKESMQKKGSSSKKQMKNKEVTLKKSEIRELTRKITNMMQSKGEEVANKEVNYQNKKISLDKFVDLCNKHFSSCDHLDEMNA